MYYLYPHDTFYRPYFIGNVELRNIKFFNETGVVIETGQGWLSGEGKDLARFALEKSPVLKRKEQFDKMFADRQPFYMKAPVKSRHDEIGYTLYVPYIASEWNSVEESNDYTTTRSFYRIYTNNRQPFHVKIYVRSEDITENVNFIEKVKEIGLLMVNLEDDLSDHYILENRAEIIKKIKEFNEVD